MLKNTKIIPSMTFFPKDDESGRNQQTNDSNELINLFQQYPKKNKNGEPIKSRNNGLPEESESTIISTARGFR